MLNRHQVEQLFSCKPKPFSDMQLLTISDA